MGLHGFTRIRLCHSREGGNPGLLNHEGHKAHEGSHEEKRDTRDKRRETAFLPQHRESVFLGMSRIFLPARLTCPIGHAMILAVSK